METEARPAITERGLIDKKGRVAGKLRISVTDRCNFACLFCMPDRESIKWLPADTLLSFDEIEDVTRVLVSLGISRVRITGGEPLLRKGVEDLIRRLSRLEGLDSIDMTTNGWFLKEKAKALKDAGLRGVTVSLHSLDRERFAKISGMDALPRVLEGIAEAAAVGLSPLKVNSVAIRGYNEDEIPSLVGFARERGISIRFIEFMPLDGLGIWSPESMVSGEEILERASRSHSLVPREREKGGTASVWGFEDGPGEVGVITPMSQPFCDDCDRIRLTADGKLLSCLFDTEYHDLKPMIRGSAPRALLADFIRAAVWKKPDGVGYMPWVKDTWEKPRNMNAIGG
jgi:cyclic pyranopterin phosphate synthase